jgi:hypothetical protein
VRTFSFGFYDNFHFQNFGMLTGGESGAGARVQIKWHRTALDINSKNTKDKLRKK